jgi:hypothetical protein
MMTNMSKKSQPDEVYVINTFVIADSGFSNIIKPLKQFFLEMMIRIEHI